MLVHPVGPFHLKPNVAVDPCFRILVLVLAYKCCIHAISGFTSFQLVNSVHVNWETFLKWYTVCVYKLDYTEVSEIQTNMELTRSWEYGNLLPLCHLSCMMWKHHCQGLLWHLLILLSLCFSYSDKYECLLWNEPTEELHIPCFKYNPNLWFADSVKHSVTNFM